MTKEEKRRISYLMAEIRNSEEMLADLRGRRPERPSAWAALGAEMGAITCDAAARRKELARMLATEGEE